MSEEMQNAGYCTEPNRMINFNQWANEAEKDENKNVKTALLMIRELTEYAFRYCDAGHVAAKVEKIATEHLNG